MSSEAEPEFDKLHHKLSPSVEWGMLTSLFPAPPPLGSPCPPLACRAVLLWHTDTFLSLIICWKRDIAAVSSCLLHRLTYLGSLYSRNWAQLNLRRTHSPFPNTSTSGPTFHCPRFFWVGFFDTTAVVYGGNFVVRVLFVKSHLVLHTRHVIPTK